MSTDADICSAAAETVLDFEVWDEIINGGNEIYLKILHEGEQILDAEKTERDKRIQDSRVLSLLKGADNKSESICLEALETVNARVDEYGGAEAVYASVARLWGAYLADNTGDSSDLSTQDVLVMMILFKLGREIHAPKRDNRVDIVRYVELLDRLMQ